MLFLFTACEQKPSIEGVWIGAYSCNSSLDLVNEFDTVRFLVDFSADSVVTKKFDYQRHGEKDEQCASPYSIKGDTLQFDQHTYIINAIAQDSLVFGIVGYDSSYVVFKRISATSENDIPELSSRAFSLTGLNYTDSLEFISDSLFLFVGSKNQNTQSNRWAINRYKSLNFLVIDHYGYPPLLINDISPDQINLTLFGLNVSPFVMKEIKSERTTADLMGKWIGKTENDSLIPPLPPPPPFLFEMAHTENLELEIGLDSLAISWGYFHWTKKYTLSATGDLLLFPDNEDIARSKLRIIEFNKNELTLQGAILSYSPDLHSTFTLERQP